MKKIYKTISMLFLCALIAALPTLLVACNKKTDKYDISRFYGEYTAENDYCQVFFRPQSEDKDYELFRQWWDITTVGENEFTYIDRNDQPAEKECDAFLLKSLKRLMGLMGSKATLSDGVICLNDSGWEIKYDYAYNSRDSMGDIWDIRDMYHNKINVGCIRFNFVDQDYNDPTFYVALYDDYVIDENGVEWEIMISKTFIIN